jgi:asparagine synthase (glutamine-hydrolysing)
MCGIWGKISNFKVSLSVEEISYINKTISVRGSDSFCYKSFDNLFFAHSRLHLCGKITHGVQPIVSKCSNHLMLFNGEIYNHKDIIYNSLHNTNSDTEVLFESIIKYGFSKTISNIKGMFAIAYYDKKNSKLYLSVDRFGQKPLYYNISGDNITFGSIAQSVTSNKATNNLNYQQLLQYYHFGFVGPLESLFSDVERVHPNQVIIVDTSNFSVINKYYNENITSNPIHEPTLDLTISKYFPQYVDSDYPIGVSLSGGIDSSLISYYYKKYYQGNKVAFTVNIEDEMFSEYDLAKRYADILKLDLIDIKIDANNCFKLWQETGNCLDEPNGDTATITNLALVKESSKHVKCLITGDGGDEIFEGYNRHAASDFLFSKSSLYRSCKFFFLKRLLSNEKVFLKFLRFIKPSLSYGDIKARTKTLERVLSQNPSDIEEFYHQAMSIDTHNIKNFFKLYETQDNRLVEFDRKFYLPGNNFTRMDKISLFHNIEARAPLVDDRLYSYSKSLNFKLKRNRLKQPLKDLHYSIFGINNVPKKGFNYPISQLINNQEFQSYFQIGLDFFENLFKKSISSSYGLSERRIYNLASFGLWFSINID